MTFGLIIFFIASFLPQHPQSGTIFQSSSAPGPWFGFFSYLTVQSGIIMVIFYTLWIVNIYKPLKIF